ncbi:MAG: hypothetical protein GYA48_14800 [Chloroflexi bacterium]|nr:hypothetical protein [Chloroflexota bacterium]
MKKTVLSLFITGLAVLMAACFPQLPVPDTGNGLVETAAAQTVEVLFTQAAFKTLVAQATQMPVVTATPFPTATLAATQTPLPPTATPAPTQVPPTPTNTPLPCDWAKFEADVTVPDGSEYEPGVSFTKTWRLRNIGSCAWTTEYDLVFDTGHAMNGPVAVALPKRVNPGETVDVSVTLVAPDGEGEYTGNWKLRNASNAVFGLGANASKPFWVKIEVDEGDREWDSDKTLDFAKYYCDASWKSSKGSVACPSSSENFSNGSVSRSSAPKLEGGYQDDEPAIIMIPSDGDDGMIQGKFPAFEVEDGDHFTALTGCMDDSDDCDVTFKLEYIADGGSVQNLKSWTEKSDGERTSINVDLSSLKDKDVQLILVVDNNNDSDEDRAFWLAPKINR